MDRPLVGVRVLELAGYLAGPMCGVMLASLGAEVIKVEPPGTGDPNRNAPPFAGPNGIATARHSDDDLSLLILKRSRGKKCITLNLKTDRGRELLLRLARKSDVVFENMQPGTLSKLGLGYESVREVNPAIIYCSISGFGQTGPYRKRVALDPIIQAMSGIVSLTGQPDGPPVKSGILIADTIAPVFAALGILAALRSRDRSGLGQYLDVSMLDCILSFLFEDLPDFHLQSGRQLRQGNRLQGVSPAYCYPTNDGHVFIVCSSEQQWQNLLHVMGAAAEIYNADYAGPPARWEHREAVDAMITAWTRGRTTAEVAAILEQHDVPCGPVNSVADLLTDQHVAERSSLVPLGHPSLDDPLPVFASRFPVRFSAFDTSVGPGRKLGMDNDAVFGDLLGLSPQEREELRAAGVI